MNQSPAVTIIIPVWGSMPYVLQAVESILSQSFQDFELLIVDDKGPDDSIAHLQKYMADKRVRILDNGVNLGFAGAMNHGLEQARGEFIAMLDADDISSPARLEKQVAYLRAHPDVGILGAAAVHITPEGKPLAPHRQPESDIEIRFQQLLMPAMYHSATMVRRSIVEKHGLRYNTALPLASDFDFWNQALRHTEAHTILEPLAYYRVHPNSLSKRKKDECTAQKIAAAEPALRDLGMEEDTLTRMRSILSMLMREQPVASEGLQELWQGLEETIAAFCKTQGLAHAPWALKATIGKWYIKTVLYTPSSGFHLRELARFGLFRPFHAAAACIHISGLLLWQTKWRALSLNEVKNL